MHFFTTHGAIPQTYKHQLTYKGISALMLSLLLMSCNNSSQNKQDTAPTDDSQPAANDVAMTVRSIVDALNVGEELDSATYNFSGILTDGRGVPLYTNIDGYPGEWEVVVNSSNSASIRNTELGDLYGEDLKEYLLKELNLKPDNLLYADNINDTTLSVYDVGKGIMQIEMYFQQTVNDMTSTGMTIILNTDISE